MSAGEEPLLAVSALNVSVAGSRLLQGIDFTLRAGEVMAILGANGAGKSTLISALSGEGEVSSQIRFAGRALSEWSLEQLSERRALSATEPAVPFALCVLDYVSLGRPFDAINVVAAHAALSETHAAQWSARNVATLSSGEQTRVQLARALYQLGDANECLWLLDEPCAHLDLAQRNFVLQLMQQTARARRRAIIFSTHDPAEALLIADQTLLLRSGEMTACGVTGETVNEKNLSHCYGVEVQRRTAFVSVASATPI